MDLVASLGLQILYGIANLALISLGLAIIFGMMRVINLAHGEFLMLGGYTVVVATNNGVNIWIAMLILAPLGGRDHRRDRRAAADPLALRPHGRHAAGDVGAVAAADRACDDDLWRLDHHDDLAAAWA